jgi:hypothetical protein
MRLSSKLEILFLNRIAFAIAIQPENQPTTTSYFSLQRLLDVFIFLTCQNLGSARLERIYTMKEEYLINTFDNLDIEQLPWFNNMPVLIVWTREVR